MSYVKCPDCGKEIHIFGQSKTEETAKELGLSFLGKIPFDPEVATLCDNGEIEKLRSLYLADAVDQIEKSFIK
jgi:hypothetical protein